MTNISIIRSINVLFADTFILVPFVFQSASLEQKTEQTSQGVLTTYFLSFKSTPISKSMDDLMDIVRRTTAIRVTDYNDIVTTLNTKHIRHKTTIKKTTNGSAGSFRGYIVDIELKTNS